MRGQDSSTPYCRCRVLYLGSSVPQASKEGLLGIQEPLRILYPEEGALGARGIDSWLSVWSNGLLLENVDEQRKKVTRFFPIESLHYCAAVRHVRAGASREALASARFLPLDSPFARIPSAKQPPLFAAVLRRTSGIKVLECHAFICKRDMAANALVRCCFHAYADSRFARGLDAPPGSASCSDQQQQQLNGQQQSSNGSALYQTLGRPGSAFADADAAGSLGDEDDEDEEQSAEDASLCNGEANHKVWPRGRDELDAVGLLQQQQQNGTVRSTRGSRPRQLLGLPPPPPPPPAPSQPLMQPPDDSSRARRPAKKQPRKARGQPSSREEQQQHFGQHHQLLYANGAGHHTLARGYPHQAMGRAAPPPLLLVPAATLPRKAQQQQRGVRAIPAAAPIVPIYAPLPPAAASYYGTTGNRARRSRTTQQADYAASTLGLQHSRRMAASQADLLTLEHQQQQQQHRPRDNSDSPDNESRFGTGIYRRKGHLNERAFSYSIRAEHRSRSHGSLASLGFQTPAAPVSKDEVKKDREIAQMLAALSVDEQQHLARNGNGHAIYHHLQQQQPLPRPRR